MLKTVKNIMITIFRACEESKATLTAFFLAFFFSFHFRTFIEVFLDGQRPLSGVFDVFVHYSVFYVCFVFALLILFHLSLKESVKKISKVVLPFFLILSIVPIIDSFFESWKIFNIAYFVPGQHDQMLLRFLTFGGSFVTNGMSPGIRIEGVLVLIVCFNYFRFKGKGILSSLGICFLTYTIAFLFCSMPFLAKYFVNAFGLVFQFTPKVSIDFLALCCVPLGLGLCFLINKDVCLEYVKKVKVGFLTYGILLYFFGMVIHFKDYHQFLMLSQETLFVWIFSFWLIFFVWLALQSLGQWGSFQARAIQAEDRRLIVAGESLKVSTILFCFCACFFASLISFEMLFLCLVLIGNEFLVSCLPLRLTRFAFVRNFHFAVTSLVVVLMGYCCGFSDPLASVSQFVLIFWGFVIVSLVNSIERRELDQQNNEISLFSYVDDRQGRTIVGGSISLMYALMALAYQNTIFSVLLLTLVPFNYLAVKLIKKPVKIVMFGYFLVLLGWIFVLLQAAHFSISLRHFL